MRKRLGELHNVERLAVGSGSLVSNVFTAWSVASHRAPGNPYSKITLRITDAFVGSSDAAGLLHRRCARRSGSMVALRYERAIA